VAKSRVETGKRKRIDPSTEDEDELSSEDAVDAEEGGEANEKLDERDDDPEDDARPVQVSNSEFNLGGKC
jgi:hypothetical protein